MKDKPPVTSPGGGTLDPTPKKGRVIVGEFTGNSSNVGNIITNARSADPLDPQTGRAVFKYGQVARNPVVKAGLDMLLSGVFWTGWEVVPRNDYERYPGFEAIDSLLIRSIEQQCSHLETDTFQNSIRGILYNALVYGFPMAELTWKSVNGEWWINKIKTKPSYQFDIYVNSVDDIERITQTTTGTWFQEDGLFKIPTSPYPVLRDGNHYGTSLLQSIYHDVIALEELERARVLASQLLAVKPIIHYHDIDTSDEELAAIKNALSKVQSASILSVQKEQAPDSPDKYSTENSFEVLDDRASADGINEIKEIIAQYERRILRAIGIPDDLGLTSTTVGSYAKAKEEMDMFLARVVESQTYLANFVTRKIIPCMVRYNYPNLPPDYMLPEFRFKSVEEEFDESRANYIATLVQTGVVRSDSEYVKEFLDIPPDVESGTAASDEAVEAGTGEETDLDSKTDEDAVKALPAITDNQRYTQLELFNV